MTLEKQETYYSTYFKPVMEYIVGLGGAVALAALFRAAAIKTDSFFIDALSVAMFCAVGGYIGVPFGLAGRQLNRIKTKKLWVALVISAPLGVGYAAVTFYLIHQITNAVDQMVKVGLVG